MVNSTSVTALSLGFLGVCASSLVGLTLPDGIRPFVDLGQKRVEVAERPIAHPVIVAAVVAPTVVYKRAPLPLPKPVTLAKAVIHPPAAPPAPALVNASFTPNPAVVSATSEDKADHHQAITLHLTYGLVSVRDESTGVARVFMPSVPAKLGAMAGGDARKMVFLQTILPLVLKVNEQIASDHKHLEAILAADRAGHGVSPDDQRWMHAKAEYYNVDSAKPALLLARMDTVPPSLALAQAAVESGWGSSTLARKHNALFGQGRSGSTRRHDPTDAAGHPFKTFPTLLAAVESYVHNLNTHDAYRSFRTQRAEMRASGQPLTGKKLAATLTAYSELGKEYTGMIRSTISANNLGHYDTAWLADDPAIEHLSDRSQRR